MAQNPDDDDPVVQEYPVRPSFLSYDETNHIAARIKPKHQKVELELALNSDCPTYCGPRGEQIAYAVDEASTSSKSQEPYYQSGLMDKQVLTSVKASEPTGRYVAGVLKNGALHLTPIHGFVQLRPSFEYLNRADDNKQTTSSTTIEDNDDDDEEAKPVVARFTKSATDESIKKKRQSFHSIEQKLAEEPWIEVDYQQPTSSKATSERMLLYCHQTDFESPEFTATSREYLKILTPKPEGKESHQVELPHGVLSMASLRKMHIADQIKALLTNAKVIQFHHLLALLGPGLDEKTILKGLHDFAVLVQGCWVIKSDVLYPKGSKSQVSGIDGEAIWPTRNYIIWLFNHKRIIERKELTSVTRIPSEELRDILEQVARRKPPQSWEFMLPTDTDFVIKHQDVVKSQMEVWQDLVARLNQSLSLTKDLVITDNDILPGLDASVRNKVTRGRSKSRESIEKQKRGGGREEEATSKKPSSNGKIAFTNETEKLSDQIESDSKINEIANIRVKMEPCDTVNIKEEPVDSNDLIEHSNEMAMDLDDNSSFVDGDSNSSSISLPFIPPAASGKSLQAVDKPPSEIFLKELEKFIKQTLKGSCLCLAEFKEILQLSQQEPGNILCSGVSDDVLEEQILNTGACQLSLKWPDNCAVSSERRKLYMFMKVGDSMDKYRKVVISMFSEGFCFKKSDINKRLQEKLGSSLTNHIFPRFMGEFCEKYGNSWYLRGTYKAAFPDR
eukprot:gene9449-17167_t